MNDMKFTNDVPKQADDPAVTTTIGGDKPAWVTPKLEDVSEQVMAQPYIRFT